ncbi:MAG TPA: DnaJ domain-containing protein [Dongiaceae bacterium]|nr:DnaJ domain-containing protein [Dongiaceae bacterium]
MLQTRSIKKICHKVAVTLDVGDGEQLLHMFVPAALRVSDVLNDERDFLPFERADGSIIMFAKKVIRSLVPIEMDRTVETSDPYDLLGVTPAASNTDLQEAYHRAVGVVHPDRIQSLGLPAEFMELATRRAAKLNDAYRKIRTQRNADLQPA